MIMPLETWVVGVGLIFCRVGGCVMTLPGFANERIPLRTRLFIAFGVTAALVPLLWTTSEAQVASARSNQIFRGIITETAIGVLIGFSCRSFMFALETMATGVANVIGLSGAMGVPIAEAEPLPSFSTFAVLAATTMIFVLDLHWEFLRGLRESYVIAPILATPNTGEMLQELLRALTESYLILLRLCSPFLLFGLVSNLAVGFMTRMAPQAPVYFISTPLLIILGMYWFYSLTPEFFGYLATDLGAWLSVN